MDAGSRAGSRLEYAALVFTVAIYALGFLFATRAPSNIRWIIWPLGASMFFFGFAFLLVGWWARRSRWPFAKLLLWNFAILAVLTAIAEFAEWRKRRPASV
jgi:hypothetical protein